MELPVRRLRIGLVDRGLAGAVAALVLLDLFEGIEIVMPENWADIGGEEGEVLPVDRLSPSVLRALNPVLVQEWPSFEIHEGGRATTVDRAIVFVDPLQLVMELDGHLRLSCASKAGTSTMRIPRFGNFASPSLIIEAAAIGSLERPVLYESTAEHGIRQYLPLGPGRLMVRERIAGPEGAIDPFFGAERAIAALDTVVENLRGMIGNPRP